MRASFRAAYITYDQATEFLVYAHGATGIKEIMTQAEEISKRTTGGMGVAIAYDASAPDTGVSWPFVWYLRDFTNQRSFDQPTRSLRDSVVIIVDEKNFDKIEPAIGPGYYRVDYIRMWWPMQDYFGLVSNRDPNNPFPEDYACNGVMSFLKLRKSRDYSRLLRGLHQSADPRGRHPDLVEPRLLPVCASQRTLRPDPRHLAAIRPHATVHPPGCGIANMELRRCTKHNHTAGGSHRREIRPARG
jgi:hypothetical protein